MRICIEGNVGAGKSTLLARLSRWWTVWPEPVAEWGELLALFYACPRRWAFAMNAEALKSFLRVPVADDAGRPIIVERSPLSCKDVFSRVHATAGVITAAEWQVITDLHKDHAWEADAYIFIKTTPGLCLERVRERGRPGEEAVTSDYLTDLQSGHMSMLRHMKKPYYMVDGAQDPELVFSRVKEIVESYDKL